MARFVLSYLALLIILALLFLGALESRTLQSYAAFLAGGALSLLVAHSLTFPPGLRGNRFLLSEDAQLPVAHANARFSDLAARYLPQIHDPDRIAGHPIVAVLYKGVHRGSTLSIAYHFCWQDETCPNRLLDTAYRLFRRLYYGAVLDIEFVQIDVDTETGLIERVLFERPQLYKGLYRGAVKHVLCRLSAEQEPLREVASAGASTLHFRVGSWNHLLEFLGGAPADAPLEAEISPGLLQIMTQEHFDKYNLLRRSNGDF